MKYRMIIIFFMALSLACNLTSSLPFFRTIEPIDLKTEIQAEGPTDIDFGNGGHLTVYAGEQDVGKTITVRADKQLYPEREENLYTIERIYQIECVDCVGDIDAVLTLPVEGKNITEEEAASYQIAYRQGDQWLILPSTYDPQSNTVSATVSHFSDFSILDWIFNHRPEAHLVVSPTMVDADDNQTPELKIKITATDEDNDPLKVKVAIQFSSFTREVADGLADYYQQNLNIFSNSCENALGPGPYCMILTESLNVVRKPGYDFQIAYELYETQPGVYTLSVPAISLEEGFQLEYIRVVALIYEGNNQKAVIEREQILPALKGTMTPPELKEPGPFPTTICPPRPEFKWELGGDPGNSIRFRLVKGENLWSGWTSDYQWTCYVNLEDKQCRGDAPPDSWNAATWVPPKDLQDGKLYSWGMVVSDNKNESQFDPKESPRSEIFQFTVDKRLKGTKCLQNILLPSNKTNALLWLENGRVYRSEIKGDVKNPYWVIKDQQQVHAEPSAKGVFSLDPFEYVSKDNIVGELEISLSARVGKNDQTISNVVKMSAGQTDFFKEGFYAVYEHRYEYTSSEPFAGSSYQDCTIRLQINSLEENGVLHGTGQSKCRNSDGYEWSEEWPIVYDPASNVFLTWIVPTDGRVLQVEPFQTEQNQQNQCKYFSPAYEVKPTGKETFVFAGKKFQALVYQWEYTTYVECEPDTIVLLLKGFAYYHPITGLLLKMELIEEGKYNYSYGNFTGHHWMVWNLIETNPPLP